MRKGEPGQGPYRVSHTPVKKHQIKTVCLPRTRKRVRGLHTVYLFAVFFNVAL